MVTLNPKTLNHNGTHQLGHTRVLTDLELEGQEGLLDCQQAFFDTRGYSPTSHATRVVWHEGDVEAEAEGEGEAR